MLRPDLDKLEALGFFIRCRYSTGTRGGLTAYSFRHPKRDDLVKAIQTWSADNRSFQAKAATHRAADLTAFTRPPPLARSAPPPPPPPRSLTTLPAILPRYP